MRFDLSDQQRDFQASVSELLRDACPKTRALTAYENDDVDLEIWRKLMEIGVGGICVPEEFDGLGLGLVDLAIVAETAGRFAAPGPFLEHLLATLAITLGGSSQQKKEYLPALVRGEMRATIAIAEPGGKWAPADWAGDAKHKYSGRKEFVLHAEHADLILVWLTGGLIAVVQGDDPGLFVEPVPATDGGKRLSHINFSNVKTDPLKLSIGSRVFDAGLTLLAADAFGGASEAVKMSVEYAKEREQFGQVIGAFQAMKHQLADMAVAIEPSIGLYWYAAHAFDADPEASTLAAALAKAHITEVYPKITRRMIEAHGGIGYTWEFGAHVWLKRALFNQAYLGTPRIHRARIANMADW